MSFPNLENISRRDKQWKFLLKTFITKTLTYKTIDQMFCDVTPYFDFEILFDGTANDFLNTYLIMLKQFSVSSI